jgi:serine protease Do
MRVEDQSIRDENHMINLISTFRAGQRIRMQVWRDNKTLTLEAEIGEWDPKRFRQ